MKERMIRINVGGSQAVKTQDCGSCIGGSNPLPQPIYAVGLNGKTLGSNPKDEGSIPSRHAKEINHGSR